MGYVSLKCTLTSAKTIPFCTGCTYWRRIQYVNYCPTQKPTKNFYLAFCVIAKTFYRNRKNSTGNSRQGCQQRCLASSLFVADYSADSKISAFNLNLCYCSYRWDIWRFTSHVGRALVIPALFKDLFLMSISAKSLTLKHIFLLRCAIQ